MAGVWADNGVSKILGVKRTYLNSCSLRLFVNNHAPVHGDTVAAYTEASFAGYAALTPLSFGAPSVDGTGKGTIADASHTWTATGAGLPQTVYGYYVTDPDGSLVYAEANGGGFIIGAAGVSYSVQLNVTDKVDPSP